jgi:exodeoxyribonuclease VII large subunit
MAEKIADKNVYSLLEVTLSIQKTIAERYKSTFWVKAEMNKLNHYSHSGHCYPELVEKKEGRVIAQLRSSLWKDDYRRVNQKFLSILKEPLKDGITILFLASIQFDPMHGLTLRIIDIDPSFSLGELEREKLETIEKLKADGIFSNNKQTVLPVLPKTIAVISVETSKGYADYIKVIDHNPWGYKINNVLFPSLLQGDKSVASIIHQLRRIRKVIRYFDAVAIIRGGGGDVGLSSFNNHELAREVALFPIPVLTGIGHSTNETVTEMVSYRNAITPTELADFILQRYHDFALPLKRAEEIIVQRSEYLLRGAKDKLSSLSRLFQSVTTTQLIRNRHAVTTSTQTILQQSRFLLRQESMILKSIQEKVQKETGHTIENHQQLLVDLADRLSRSTIISFANANNSLRSLEKDIQNLDPANILKRGFSITMNAAGNVVKDSNELIPGESITTILASGKVISTVNEVNPSDEQ